MNMSVIEPRPYRLEVQSLNTQESEHIDALFDKLANSSYTQLFFNRRKIESYQETLGQIHPLNFLESALVCPKRRENLEKIRMTSTLIWAPFANGIKTSLEKEEGHHNLYDFVEQFAQKLGVSENEILPYLKNKEISALVDFILSQSSLNK